MGSLDINPSKASLPILSLTSPNLAKELYTACRDHGFFYLTDHGVAQSILDNILDLARCFFLESSAEEKTRIKRRPAHEGGDGARGYQVLNENVTKGLQDFHEGVDFYREFNAIKNDTLPSKKKYDFLRGPNLWPAHPPELKHVYEQYIEQCKKVGADLVRIMGDALGLVGEEKDTLTEATENSFWVMRMIGYPPLQDKADEQGVSCGEHSGIISLYTWS
jgi:isopenicillin N synthase-like dioxygenase